MTFKEIRFGSVEYKQECALRDEILRRPLGLNLYDEDLVKEKDQLHFGLFDGRGRFCACVVAVPVSGSEAKVRQMAVAQDCRGRGYGRRIMGELEESLGFRGYTHVWLHARVRAAGFYEKLGYSVTGGEFIEVTVPHVRMDKRIGPHTPTE